MIRYLWSITRVDIRILLTHWYSAVLCYHPYLVSLLFADLLSLHVVTFLISCVIQYHWWQVLMN